MYVYVLLKLAFFLVQSSIQRSCQNTDKLICFHFMPWMQNILTLKTDNSLNKVYANASSISNSTAKRLVATYVDLGP